MFPCKIPYLLVFIFQNPADRVPVHVKFKAAELFTIKYGISFMCMGGIANDLFYGFKRIISNNIGFVTSPCISENTKNFLAAAC